MKAAEWLVTACQHEATTGLYRVVRRHDGTWDARFTSYQEAWDRWTLVAERCPTLEAAQAACLRDATMADNDNQLPLDVAF